MYFGKKLRMREDYQARSKERLGYYIYLIRYTNQLFLKPYSFGQIKYDYVFPLHVYLFNAFPH